MSQAYIKSKQPQILKLHDVDTNYRNLIYNKFMMTVQALSFLKLVNINSLRATQQYLKIANYAIYNYIAFVRCRRTLGEEYTYINYYNYSDDAYQGTTANRSRRLWLFFLSTFGMCIFKRMFKKYYTTILEKSKSDNKPNLLTIIFSRMPEFDDLVDKLNKCILIIFLIKSDYSNMVERILKLTFVYRRKVKEVTINYRREGLIMLLQLLVELIYEIYQVIRAYKNVDTLNTQQQIKVNQQDTEDCSICADKMVDRSITPCGHSFCWGCIIKATELKPECPFCKSKCSSHRIMQLRNY